MGYEINQFQDIFMIGSQRIVVDYFWGKIIATNHNTEDGQVLINYSSEYEKPEIAYSSRLHKVYEKKTQEITIVIIPSYNCNMECEYCYEGNSKNNSMYISEEEGDRILKFINEKKYSLVNFVLLGGEPIMESNLAVLRSFFSKMKKSNVDFDISCVSNGLEIVDRIDDIKNLNIRHFQLTLDGTEEVHNRRKVSKDKTKNSYNEVCDAISVLLTNNIEVTLRVNVDQYNVHELPQINKLIRDNRWNEQELFTAYIYPVTYSGHQLGKKYLSEKELFELVIIELLNIPIQELTLELDFHGIDFVNLLLEGEMFVPKLKFCDSCGGQLVFDGNKKIYTCWWGSNDASFEVGTYKNGAVCIDTEKMKVWSERSIETIGECRKCKYKYICGGGCVFKAYEDKHSLMAGRCAEFYEIIKLYFEYKHAMKSTYNKAMFVKFYMIKDYIRRKGLLVLQVEGDSMHPTIQAQEKVTIFYDLKNLKEGDIVLYKSLDELKIHRIIKKKKDFYSLKGDAEDYIEDIHISDIIGKVKEKQIGTGISEKLVRRVDNLVLEMHIHNNELMEVSIR